MGLTKQYLRFVPAGVFGVVASARGNIQYLRKYKNDDGSGGRYCVVPACEHVLLWDVRKQECVLTLEGDKHEVSSLLPSPDGQHIAVGYSNGNINMYNLHSAHCTLTFSAHRTAVTALSFDINGLRLASGGKDTQVILWDIVCERGLYKLSGHKDMVTCVRFLHQQDILITSSKDSYIKFWDLDTQHCFKTLVSHRAEVWSFVVTRDESRLVTGSSDQELRVWRIQHVTESEAAGGGVSEEGQSTEGKKLKVDDMEPAADGEEEEDKDSLRLVELHKLGSVSRTGRTRVGSITTDTSGTILLSHGTDSIIDVFKICSEEEARKSVQKRERKRKKKLKSQEGVEAVVTESSESLLDPELRDELRLVHTIRLERRAKVKCCDVVYSERSGEAKVMILLSNNSIEQRIVHISPAPDTNTRSSIMSMRSGGDASLPVPDGTTSIRGHASDVRCVAFSHDDTALMSACGDTVKVWNLSTQRCVRTMPCDYALSCMFAPGDRYTIIGCKSGSIQIFDIASAALIHSINAHSGSVWSLALAPDLFGFASASADKQVKFWNFELVSRSEAAAETDSSPHPQQQQQHLGVEHTRTLELEEDALCVRFSSNQKLVAVALLDCTVKVFYADSLKFFLSLYGHKLPVTCVDISTDSSLIVTGSADRNIKVWGLDFGDCHKSLFAHDDSIMSLQFLPNTHMFFSCGKDKMLRQWDADNFEKIITLQGHHSEVWSLAVSHNGQHVVTASHDKSIRVWSKTQEPLVLEEEREMEREAEQESSDDVKDDPTVLAGESSTEIGLAGKKTSVTLTAADRLMEALDLYREELQGKLGESRDQQQQPIRAENIHPVIRAHNVDTPDRYVLEVIKRIKSSELEKCVLLLHLTYLTTLLPLLSSYIRRGWEIELCCSLLFFLLRVHHQQIITNHMLLSVITELRTCVHSQLSAYKDVVGYNLAGLEFLQQQVEGAADGPHTTFTDVTGAAAGDGKRKRRKKRAAASAAAILSVNAM